MRLRILYGMMILLAGLGLYALLVMRLAVAIVPNSLLFELPYYSITGLAWIWPAARLTAWMQDLPEP